MQSKVADAVREQQREETRALSIDERLARMRELGERQIEDFMAAQGISREEAIWRMERARQAGRQPSRVMDGIIDASRPDGTGDPR